MNEALWAVSLQKSVALPLSRRINRQKTITREFRQLTEQKQTRNISSLHLPSTNFSYRILDSFSDVIITSLSMD